MDRRQRAVDPGPLPHGRDLSTAADTIAQAPGSIVADQGGKSGLSMREQLIDVMQNKWVGLDTIVVASEAITNDAKFNRWFADAKKLARDDHLIDLLELYDEATKRCATAIEEFDKGGNTKDLNRAVRDFSEQLRETMVMSKSKFLK
jgi:hypothetical protein